MRRWRGSGEGGLRSGRSARLGRTHSRSGSGAKAQAGEYEKGDSEGAINRRSTQEVLSLLIKEETSSIECSVV